MPKRLTLDHVKNFIEKQGYKWLSNKYVNNSIKLKLKCPENHIFWMGFGGFQEGHRCPKCSQKRSSEKQRYTLEYVESFIKKHGYECLSNRYVNAHGKLKFKCPKEHMFDMRWDCFQQGQRCPICKGNKKKTIEEIKEFVSQYNYICLSNIYVNSGTKLKFKCPKGHIFKMGWDGFYNGYCPKCARINLSINKTGKGNPQWKGGISFEPYCPVWTDKEFKELIKERDSYFCLNPCCTLKKSTNIYLVVHHIDYNKKNCVPTNLITLCNSCNSKANKDREWHKSWYRAILHKRYKYLYLTGKEIKN